MTVGLKERGDTSLGWFGVPYRQDRPPNSLDMWVASGDHFGVNVVELMDNTFVLREVEVELDF